MRSFTGLILLVFLVIKGHSQEEEMNELTPVRLRYEVLDSAEVNAMRPLINIHQRNIGSFYSNNGIRLAYCLKDKNKWISIPLPFNERTNDFEFVNLDNKGQPELVVRGDILQYGSGGGTGTRGVIILNVDSVPVRIFRAFYRCWEESFGDRSKNGEGPSMESFGREILVKPGTVTITAQDKKRRPYDDCELTNLPGGNYTLVNGRFRLKR